MCREVSSGRTRVVRRGDRLYGSRCGFHVPMAALMENSLRLGTPCDEWHCARTIGHCTIYFDSCVLRTMVCGLQGDRNSITRHLTAQGHRWYSRRLQVLQLLFYCEAAPPDLSLPTWRPHRTGATGTTPELGNTSPRSGCRCHHAAQP